MATRHLWTYATASLVVTCAACGSGDDSSAVPSTDASVDVPPVSGLAQIRVAQWSVGTGAIDVCTSVHGVNSFQGPLLARAFGSSSGDASTFAGLSFPDVSAYFTVPGTQYDVRLVHAGAADCSHPLAADLTTFPLLGSGSYATIAVIGEVDTSSGGAPVSLAGFTDDSSTSGIALRFLNADPAEPLVDFGTGSVKLTFKGLELAVPFGGIATAFDGGPSVDKAGYISPAANSGNSFVAMLSGHATGQTVDSAVSTSIALGPGGVVTLVLVPSTSSGADASAAYPDQLLECVDNAGTAGSLANCSLVSP